MVNRLGSKPAAAIWLLLCIAAGLILTGCLAFAPTNPAGEPPAAQAEPSTPDKVSSGEPSKTEPVTQVGGQETAPIVGGIDAQGDGRQKVTGLNDLLIDGLFDWQLGFLPFGHERVEITGSRIRRVDLGPLPWAAGQVTTTRGRIDGQQPSTGAASAPPVSGLVPSQVVWNSPENVRMDQSVRIEVRVTRNREQFQAIVGRLRAPGTPMTERVDLGSTLMAQLVSTAFKISPEGSAEPRNEIDGRDFEWSWVLEPLKPGTHTLQLTITSEFRGGPSVENFSRLIKVVALPAPVASMPAQRDQTFDFVLKNWDKLLTLILVPVGGAAWAYFRRRRREALRTPLPSLPSPTT